MKGNKIPFVLAMILIAGCSTIIQVDQPGWQRVFGDNYYSEANDIILCQDGGYFITGMTMISSNNVDVYALKLDPKGNEEWHLEIGGKSFDVGYSAAEAPGGRYILAGYTESYGKGKSDGWIIGIQSNGTVAWNYTFGGEFPDELYSIREANNGGFIVCGMTLSYSEDTNMYDAWVMKINSRGVLEWQSIVHMDEYDSAFDIQPTSDGGYIFVGRSGDLSLRNGRALAIKLNQYGDVIWKKSYGSNELNVANTISATSDSNYIIAGYCVDQSGNDDGDGWIARIDDSGELKWMKTYGNRHWDNLKSIIILDNEDILLSGVTAKKPLFADEDEDIWIMRLDEDGQQLWQESLGEKGHDMANAVIRTEDGGFAVVGRSGNDNGGEIDDDGNIIPGYHLVVIKFNI